MALPWVRMDTAWYQNPKFLALMEDKKWRSISLYWGGVAWSGGQGQAGFVPYYALPIIQGTRKESNDLVEVRLWEHCDGGWNIHDWSEYQPSNEAHEARSKRAREAALARWNGGGNHRTG